MSATDQRDKKLFVLTSGVYSDYGIEAILWGPTDADMVALKAQHEVLKGSLTPRQLGHRAYRHTETRTGRTWICIYRPESEWPLSDDVQREEVPDELAPELDAPVAAWLATFVDWLLALCGFTMVAYEEFDIGY